MTVSTRKPDRPARFVRMWHLQNGEWCHSWDVEDAAYRTWKEGNGPLPSSAVFLPNGRHPLTGTQVSCGTCSNTRVIPKEMKQEFMRE